MHKNMHLTYSNSVSKVIDMKVWLPEEIEALRKSQTLSRRVFSELLGVTGNYVYLLEKGVKTPSATLRLLLDCVERELDEKEKGKESEKKHGKAQRSL
jgi:DNA-binding transcriptional regulator YiaG